VNAGISGEIPHIDRGRSPGNMRYKWEPTVRGDRTGAARRDASAVRRDPGTVHAGVVPAGERAGQGAPAAAGRLGSVLLGCSPRAARTAGAFFAVTVPMNLHVAAAIQPIRAAVVSTVTLRRFRS
jgi:hypothetical protein